MSLRVYAGDEGHVASEFSTVQDFFLHWYVPNATKTKRRKPTSMATINSRRRPAVKWWTRLMATKTRPFGPLLNEVTDDHLLEFREFLRDATYRRGRGGQLLKLGEKTQVRTVEEIEVVLGSAGPAAGRKLRAGFIADPPKIYLEQPPAFPKDTLTFEEAKQTAMGLDTFEKPKFWKESTELYRLMAKATLAFWFYTGHRATSYQFLKRSDRVERRNGCQYLQIRKSVKTSKAVRLVIHPQLSDCLNALPDNGQDSLFIDWPIRYNAVAKNSLRWQRHAGIVEPLSPQTWRRLFDDEIAMTPYKAASKLASMALDHSSSAVTEGSYSTAARDMAILSLPNLFAD
jgi:hypothetical protein